MINVAVLVVKVFDYTDEDLAAERALEFSCFQNSECHFLIILNEDDVLGFLFLTYCLKS